MIALLTLLFTFSVHASSMTSELQPIFSARDQHRSVVTGQVRYGHFINCEIFNETSQDFTILRYVYETLVRDAFGQLIPQTQLFQCVSGCFVESFSSVRLSGPRNSINIVQSRCKALVRTYDWNDDDDWYREGPKVFDRW